ncbi:ATP-binding protein [Nodosilinea sp. PGN35]
MPAATAPQGERAAALLAWVETTGPGLTILQDVLGQISGKERPDRPAHCPYKGLSYFDCNGEDYQNFYGREALTQVLLDKVTHGNFLALVGASGSGKSSVLRAGLLQQLKDKGGYEIRILVPGEHPLQSLALAFVEAGWNRLDRAEQQQKAKRLIQSGAEGLCALVETSLAEKVVLVVDQFEEAFAPHQDTTERLAFFETLLGGLDAAGTKLCLILAMRSDFVGKCFEQHYGGLARWVQKHLEPVLPMTQEELTRAIEEPARQSGVGLEPGLTRAMLDDLQQAPGRLPLLQYTLTELWHGQQNHQLTFSTYHQLGGVAGALKQRADDAYSSLTLEQQQTAKHIFMNLTHLGEGAEDTRRRVTQASLVTPQHPEARVAEVVKHLADANLVVTDDQGELAQGQPKVTVEVAHEALIRSWPQLREWLDDDRKALIQQRSLEQAAQEWDHHSRAQGYLLSGKKLADAVEYDRHYKTTFGLSDRAQDLLRHSRHRQRRDRVAIATLVVGISSLAVIAQGQRSQRQFQEQYAAVLVGAETSPPLVQVLPRALATAERQAARENINAAIESYKALLIATRRFESAAQGPEGGFQAGDRQIIQTTAQQAEANLADLLAQHYLPAVAQDLDQQQWGSLIDGTLLTDYEDQYEPGALRSTYTLLMRTPGLKADLNDNGVLDATEAFLIPCPTLVALETLWRQATNNRCGFRAEDDDYFDDNCGELLGHTLSDRIFSRSDSFIERAAFCRIPGLPP